MHSLQTSLPSDNLNAMRNNEIDLIEYINKLEKSFHKIEDLVLAFVPEEGRFVRLRREARELVEKYPHPEDRPDLFGLLVGVKDIFHVDGFLTRGGSNVPAKILQGNEARCVTQLKEAGALVMGKTVTTEFAYFAPGATRNPHNLEHTPGGSSSGSAAAVAAKLVPMAFGTQTIGSITRPASYCGVIGFKPSYERISRAGVIPLSHSLDHIGFFTNELALAEKIARQLVENWQTAQATIEKPVIGTIEGAYWDKAWPEMQAHFRETVSLLKSAGYTIKAVSAMPDFDAIVERHGLIVAAEAAQTHEKWFAQYRENYHFKTAELIESGQAIATDALNTALEGRKSLREALTRLMEEHGIDIWLSPSAPGPAPKGMLSTGDPIMNLPLTHSGLPTLGIPSGKNAQGLPLGLQIAAPWYEDEKLFDYGQGILNVLQEITL